VYEFVAPTGGALRLDGGEFYGEGEGWLSLASRGLSVAAACLQGMTDHVVEEHIGLTPGQLFTALVSCHNFAELVKALRNQGQLPSDTKHVFYRDELVYHVVAISHGIGPGTEFCPCSFDLMIHNSSV
jgi:hypothetical protein